MRAFCDDFAIIRNKRALKEIGANVSNTISKILNASDFEIEDYILRKEKIVEYILSLINKSLNNFGIVADNFLISNVILPKKDTDDNYIKEIKSKQESFDHFNVDVSKLVEERLDNLQKDLNVVYVNEKGENSIQNVNSFNLKVPNVNQNPVQNFSSKPPIFRAATEKQNDFKPIDQPEPNIIKTETTNSTDDFLVDDALVDEIIERINKRKVQKKNHRIVEILAHAGALENIEKTKISKSKIKCKHCGAVLAEGAKYCFKCGKATDELIICPCCGAKNFPTAQICCICKSKLE